MNEYVLYNFLWLNYSEIFLFVIICVFWIWTVKFVMTTTSVPRRLQSPLTTRFKADYTSFRMNGVLIYKSTYH